MSPADARRLALVAELERDWEQVVARLDECHPIDPVRGPEMAAYVALLLHHSYQAFETFMVRLERALGLPERTGPTWHIKLLSDAARPIPGLRPQVIPADALRGWEALLRFRHFLRHAYGVALDPEELRDNVRNLEHAVSTSRESVADLIRALRE